MFLFCNRGRSGCSSRTSRAVFYQVEQKLASDPVSEYVVVAPEVRRNKVRSPTPLSAYSPAHFHFCSMPGVAQVSVSGLKSGRENTFRVRAGFSMGDASYCKCVAGTLTATV